MNKTYLTLMILISAFSFSHAQMRNKDKWGCSVTINSIQAQVEVPILTGPGALLVDADGNILSGGDRVDKSSSYSIIPKYHFNEDILLRLEFGLTNLNLKANSDQKSISEHAIVNTEVATKIYRIAPGFQWTFIKAKKLESYCGIQVSYNNYKFINHIYNYEHRNIENDTLLYSIDGKEQTPGGFAFGFGALAGFNIYLNNWFSIGSELSYSIMYYDLGGETTIQETQQVNPNPSLLFASTWTNSYSGFKISKIMTSFNISVWF